MYVLKAAAIIGLCLLSVNIWAQEKSKEEKDKEAWANFQKIIEERHHNDWPWLGKYRTENAKIDTTNTKNRVGLIGDSILEGWYELDPDFFKSNNFINRGIGGQTSAQMLLRFRQDVIHLKPRVVVILAGTNDIAGNNGPSTLQMIEDNIASMAELARANKIQVVLSSVLPVFDYPWKKGIEPASKIAALNKWIKNYAQKNGDLYLDYYSPLVDEKGGMMATFADDGVHPNRAGYAIMKPLLQKAITLALGKIDKQN